MDNLGSLLKEFREERNFTQSDLSSGIVSRETIAKIETTNQRTSFSTFLKLLEKMGVSLSEFQMKLINKDEDDFSKLIVMFSYQLHNVGEVELLEKINELSNSLYMDTKNNTIYHIKLVSEAYLLWNDYDGSCQSLSLIKKIVRPIWNDLQLIDNWTMLDIRILKSILFLLEVSVAEQITEAICWVIDRRYQALQNIKVLCWSNLSYAMILSKEYDKALVLLEKVKLEASLVNMYDIRILADIRSIYLQQNLGWQELLQEKYNMLDDLGGIRFRESIEKEVNVFEKEVNVFEKEVNVFEKDR